MIKYVTGNLVQMVAEGHFDVAVHGCNCFCTMGSGVARAFADAFPEVYEADLRTIRGDRNKLGSCSYASLINVDAVVINAYTQFRFGGERELNYEALYSVLEEIIEYFNQENTRFGFPKIGCGLAGGEWTIVEAMINHIFKDCDVTVVELPETE